MNMWLRVTVNFMELCIRIIASNLATLNYELINLKMNYINLPDEFLNQGMCWTENSNANWSKCELGNYGFL